MSHFTSSAGSKLIYGQAKVRIPRHEVLVQAGRRANGIGLVSQSKSELTSAGALKVLGAVVLDSSQAYAEAATAILEQASLFKKQALVFVHGFDVSFQEALQRTAQIAFDLEFDGFAVPFSWASQGRQLAYLSDTASADEAVDHLVSLLTEFRKRMPQVRVNIVGHSMGNLVILRALERIADRSAGNDTPNIGEIILAHADVDARRCEQLLRNIRPIVSGITLYINKDDWALWVSKHLRGKARCGASAAVYEGVETIDTTGISVGRDGLGLWPKGWNHDVVVRNRILFGDMTRLLLEGIRPPNYRTPELSAVTNKDGATYWRYDPAKDLMTSREHQKDKNK